MNPLPPLDVTAPVSVVMTVRDEEAGLKDAVRSVLDNGYEPGVQVVIAVAPSSDRTADVAAELAAKDAVTVVDNPAGATPQGLNAALAAATHDVVVRVDGHGALPPGYIAHAVRVLAETGAANVGGRMLPDAAEPLPRAIAVAMRSRWGIGGAGHRVGGKPGPAESVFLGCFRRQALDEVGGYDEHYVRAQDWELNYRLRAAGYTVWFDPQLAVAYRPRRSWAALLRQFYHSGRWRREVARRHRLRTSVRYLAPPIVAVAVGVGLAVGAVGLVVSEPWLWWGFLAPVGYVAGVIGASTLIARQAGWPAACLLPGVLMSMHMAWGLGFLRGVR